jgi:hypothetical protein
MATVLRQCSQSEQAKLHSCATQRRHDELLRADRQPPTAVSRDLHVSRQLYQSLHQSGAALALQQYRPVSGQATYSLTIALPGLLSKTFPLLPISRVVWCPLTGNVRLKYYSCLVK